ncbi:ankyrin repeat domain-containing protein [Phenylobacterium sp.]|uniref:ankyrin repeat domain-containing protein n=1 Tax=Phenylobacterium sp. TaxID=1871053 RepID=UPI0035B352F0
MKRIVVILSVVAASVIVGCTQPAASMERKINGRSASELFPDPKVAALAKAACSGDEKTVARQIAAGANPNAVGNERAVPLLWAIRCRNLRGVEALLDGGANPNQLLGGDFSVVYAAAQEPVEILKALLNHGGDPNAGSKESERSALMSAMSMGIHDDKWANYYAILEAGADINRVYGTYNTISIFAADMAQYDKLAELLDRGYNYDLSNLGAHVQVRAIRPDLEPKRAKVKAMLEARGVQFPVPSQARGTSS